MQRDDVWKVRSVVVGLGVAVALAGCGGGGGGGGAAPGTTDQTALLQEIEASFPFQADQPLDQLFICQIGGSSLTWYFNFFPAGQLEIYTTLDTGADLLRNGSYTYQGGIIDLEVNNDAVVLNESSIELRTALGMVSAFRTRNLQCATYGHRYNAREFGSTLGFDCPESNIQAASSDDNALEFVHRSVPFEFAVAGSAFRQRDRFVQGAVDPLIRRGFGIYRRAGDRFYVFFDGGQFDDFNYLSGRFANGDLAVTLDQTPVASGACQRR